MVKTKIIGNVTVILFPYTLIIYIFLQGIMKLEMIFY